MGLCMPKPFQNRGSGSGPSDEDWLKARRTARELDRVLDAGRAKKDAIVRAAAELHLTTRQIYNLLARYQAERRITVLLPRLPSERRKRLSETAEEIIRTTLRDQWMILEAPPLAPVVAEIRARCEEAGVTAPSYVTISRRIPSLFSTEEIAKKRSANPKHLMRLKPRPGYIHAPNPLDVCQIDHTPTDINFVEVINNGGLFIGRPYLTVVTDVSTRAILGFCLTLEKPSVLSVALCLAQAICRKDGWLASRSIDHAWPMFGRPKLLLTDSAKEFKGNAFQLGCDDYGIRIRHRDRGRVHQGGVVERLLGKLNGVLSTYPGSSGRSVADRDGYPSERRACLDRSSANSLTNAVPGMTVRRASIRVARNSFPTGPGSPFAGVSKTASRSASSSSFRPSMRAATAADLRARRSRQLPSQGGSARIKSSRDFSAIPAAKAASIASMSRPCAKVQPGR